MRLLLRESVQNLGTIGEVVEVADGYGRNYLLPLGIAIAVTPENLQRMEVEKQRLLADEAACRKEFEEIAVRIRELSVTIPMAASEEGHLYGSVNAQVIAKAMEAAGVPVESKAILMDKPIKELGVYEIPVRLHVDLEVSLKVWVVEQQETQE